MKWGRADIFLPFLKKSRRTGWHGKIWQGLDRIGSVTRSSPIRRLVQITCLVLFLDAFFRVCWPYASNFTSGVIEQKEYLPVETFLLIDPLVGLSTALAGRVINTATIVWLIGIFAFCIIIPRAFCGYLCPLGTLIDGFDWLIGRHFRRWHVPDNPTTSNGRRGWVHIKYYLLAGVLATSLFGLLTSGFASAIPVLTRGLLFSVGRGQLWILKGESNLPPIGLETFASLVLFAIVFLLSLRGRRFWCRYVCPSGALLSVANFFRVGERKVENSCINCNKCVEICPFDAIKEDYTTRTNDCTYCQSCGGVCPTASIKFVTRWNKVELKVLNEPPVEIRPLSRRGFVTAGIVGASISAGTKLADHIGFPVARHDNPRPLRPPGSVPEDQFLDLCIRCGECFKVCPGPVLHPAGLQYGWESLWTPIAAPEHAGCHQDCNFCTQVCPTGAIQPLDLLVKRQTHMGLAKLNTDSCLPYREDGREDCNLCYLECKQAGYHAIQMQPMELPVNRAELESQGFSEETIDEMSSIMVPVVDAKQCVGCGICTYRCHTRFVKQEKRLEEAAIFVVAENEHRSLAFPSTPDQLGPPNTK